MNATNKYANLGTSGFVNTQVKKEDAVEVDVASSGVEELSLEEAIAIARQNSVRPKGKKKKKIFTSTQQSTLSQLTLQQQVSIQKLGNMMLQRMSLFETLWRQTGKIRWTAELTGLMACLLYDVANKVANEYEENTWPIFLTDRTDRGEK